MKSSGPAFRRLHWKQAANSRHDPRTARRTRQEICAGIHLHGACRADRRALPRCAVEAQRAGRDGGRVVVEPTDPGNAGFATPASAGSETRTTQTGTQSRTKTGTAAAQKAGHRDQRREKAEARAEKTGTQTRAKAGTEKTYIHMEKRLEKGNARVATIEYKKDSKEKLGKYIFFGEAPN